MHLMKREGMFDLHETCMGGGNLGWRSEELACEVETIYIEHIY